MYRRVNDTTFALALDVHTSFQVSGSVDETFRYDRPHGLWSLDAGNNRFFDAIHLAAQPWTAQGWAFSGTEVVHGISRPVRIVYSFFVPGSFTREHQIRSEGLWKTDGAFLCRRATSMKTRYGPPLPADVALRAVPFASVRDTLPASGSTAPSKAAQESPTTIAGMHESSAAPSAALRAPRTTVARSPVPVALGTTPRPLATRANDIDRAYSLTQGVWECKAFGNAEATHTYTREADGTIKLHNVLSITNHRYAIDEIYRFDPVRSAWTTVTSSGAYAGIAGKWLTDKWVFDGDMPLGGRRVPVQMIYSRLGARAFRRDFVRLQGGAWTTFAAETCELR